MGKSKKVVKFQEIGKVYGYLRVSTEGQNLDNNKEVITKKRDELGLIAPIEWIEEKISGTVDWKKRELGSVFENFKENDILIISELSRISRKALEIQEFISVCNKKGVKIYSLDVPGLVLDGSLQSNMYISMLALGAQIERDNISTRTRNALAKKRLDYDNEGLGRKLGRPLGTGNKNLKLDPYKKIIKEKILSGVNLKRIGQDYGVSHQTVCNYVKRNCLKPHMRKDQEDQINTTVNN